MPSKPWLPLLVIFLSGCAHGPEVTHCAPGDAGFVCSDDKPLTWEQGRDAHLDCMYPEGWSALLRACRTK